MAHSIPRQKLTACTAQLDSGKFCDAESLPDAPFPICVKHAAEIMRYINSCLPRDNVDRTIAVGHAIRQKRDVEAERDRMKPPVRGHVYYVQVGKLIKIGHTDNLRQRLGAYPPDARLLATEIGTVSLEKQRHREFAADLKHRNEWFAPSPALMDHINALREAAAA